MKRRSIIKLLGLALPTVTAVAQPVAGGKPIRIIVPTSTGTPSDTITRLVGARISAVLGQPVVADNKAGANGLLAMQELMRSPPDGSTLLMGSVSPLAINMALVKNLSYDPRRDLTPIASLYSGNHAWVVRPSNPVRSMADLIAYAKANPGKISVGHSSALQQMQLSALEKMAGVDLLMVPYKASATNLTDFMGGTVDLALLDMGSALSMAKTNQVRVLAISPAKRSPLATDVPAVAETVPGYDFSSWSALVGPAGMPRETVNRLNAAMNQVLKQKDIPEKFEQSGAAIPMMMTPDELKAHIDAEVAKWVRVAREARIDPE